VSVEKGRLIARGRTAEVYEWGEGRVLKLLFDWCPPEWARQEAERAAVVTAAGLPAPPCHGTVDVDGRKGIVFERIEGQSMLTLIGRRPWRAFAEARRMAALHADIHAHSGEGLPPLKRYLERSLKKVDGLEDPTRERLLSLLESLPDGEALCHFDFHPGQISLSAAGPVILDWMGAFQGNAMADVARTLLLMKIGGVTPASRLEMAAVGAVRAGLSRAYLKRYLALNGNADQEEIWRWMVIIAAARLTEGIEGEEEPLRAFIDASLGSGEP